MWCYFYSGKFWEEVWVFFYLGFEVRGKFFLCFFFFVGGWSLVWCLLVLLSF